MKTTRACPSCSSTDVAEYWRGLVAYDDELEKRLANNEIILAGCEEWPGMPDYRCNTCRTNFTHRGKIVEGPDETWKTWLSKEGDSDDQDVG